MGCVWRIRILAVILTLGALLLMGTGPVQARENQITPRLQGTFLQLTKAHEEWPQKKWQQLFQYFRDLRLNRLIIQWTVYDDLDYPDSQDDHRVSQATLETVLSLADAEGLEVLVGLVYDPFFWQRVNREPPLVAVYLRRLRVRELAAAHELLPLVRAHPSFRGWYFSEEIDDVHWQKSAPRRVLAEHLRKTGLMLRAVTPEARLAISGFANGRTDPHTLGNIWRDLLLKAPIDEVLFQDGVGAKKLSLADLPIYLPVLRDAIASQGKDFRVVVELFRQVSSQPFRAKPAPWAELECQLSVSSKYSTNGLMAFSVPEYLTPLGGPEAAQLFQSYLGWFRSSQAMIDMRNN